MSTAREIVSYNRPNQAPGRGDKYLPEAAQELSRRLRKISRQFSGEDCRLQDKIWIGVAALVIDWAEDIHNDLGLWRAAEQHQQNCLGTPLPLFVPAGASSSPSGFDPLRISFLLWNLWFYFRPDNLLSPRDPDLGRIAETCANYLNERFERLPKDSAIRHFLAQPNPFGWEVKKKLAWLGCNSYLFRWSFFWAMREGGREDDNLKVDEFLVRHFSRWSGLGAVDVLASVLPLSTAEREELQSWHNRHMSLYRVIDIDQAAGWVNRISAKNLVNGEQYAIRVEQDLEQCPFLPARVVFGWLVPWHGEWCWSGEQRLHGEVPETEDPKLRDEVIRALGHFVYCYCPAEEEKAREIARKMHEEFVALYGGELTVFPDGKTAQATDQKRLDRWQQAHSELFGLPPGPVEPLRFPKDFRDCTRGVAAFSSPVTGVEYARDFDLVQSGLAKKGAGVSEEEATTLRGFIMAPEISPAFVRHVTAEPGPASILEAFGIRDYPVDAALEFLLRRSKGEWYAKIYPNLAT